MGGKFSKTLTLTLADTPYQISALMIAADLTAELHVAEIHAFGDIGNSDKIYQGDVTMVSPGAGLAPVSYGWAYSGDSNPFEYGSGEEINSAHMQDFWVMSPTAGQKIHWGTRVV